MRYYVTFVKNGRTITHSFDTEKEAVHFAKLVNGKIVKDY